MTEFTELVGCEHPVQLAPMGAPGVNPELQNAVADAGGHPVHPAVLVTPERLAEQLDALSESLDSVAVNFIVQLIEPEAFEIALARASMIDFFLAEPDRTLVDKVHAAGALASWQVGSRAEAIKAEEAGCDLIVAQGVEAGGRVRGSLELLPLLDQVLDAVTVPVVAAGGIATPDRAAAALDAGASGIRVGTRLLASEEADAHPSWKQALLDATDGDTVVTEAFSVGVPSHPHRVLRRSLEAAESHDPGPVGEIDLNGRRTQIELCTPHPPTTSATGSIKAMPFYAGTSSAAINEIKPAAEIVTELAGVRETAR